MLNFEVEIYCCINVLQVGAFSVLKELVIVLPDCLADHIGSLTPGIEKALCVSFPFFLFLLKYLSNFICLKPTFMRRTNLLHLI